MNQRLITDLGKSQRLQIVNLLKRSRGRSVNELAALLRMSYMGVKQHCDELRAEGYADTWRRPKPIGRPEMVLRLTMKAHALFPTASNAATVELLQAAQQLYGPAAAEKLLLRWFQARGERYAAKVLGETLPEKARALAKLRDAEGCLAEVIETEGGAVQIVEFHAPILDLLHAFPIVARLETELFQRVLEVPVRRLEETASGLYECTFFLGAGVD